MTTAVHETDAARLSREIRERAADDATIGDREVSDRTAEAAKMNQIGRIEEVRAALSRNAENYHQTLDQGRQRLRAMVGPSTDPDVRAAAKAVADAYDIELSNAGLKQPKTPTKHSPFAD